MKQSLFSALPAGHPWRRSIHYFDSIDSTNTRAKEMAAAGAPQGTVLVADHQTGGRGRMGRSFLSPEGVGVYLSVILRPGCTPDKLMHLTCAAAVAACEAVEAATGASCGIKWTNDLVCGSKKLAGILTELALAPDGTVQYAVVGIGINCLQQEGDFAPEIRDMAGSLAMFSSQVHRGAVAAGLIQALYDMNQRLLTQKPALMEAYRRRCITIGREVSVHRFQEVAHGMALDVDGDGALIVGYPDGTQEAVAAGEVSIRGMYGYV